MKYYFSENCYWDDNNKKVYRNGKNVKITPSQTKLLTKLIEKNGARVSHEELFYAMTGDSVYSGFKTALSNQFTRNKKNEKGLYVRVPELREYIDHSKSQIGGGYKILIPEENIVVESNKEKSSQERHREWFSSDKFSEWEKQASNNDEERQYRLMSSFLQGGRCIWPIVFYEYKNKPVRRKIVDTIKKQLDAKEGAFVLTGAGGEGKTTALMQLCVELYQEGKTVYFHAPTYRYDIRDIPCEGILVIDNPANTMEFKRFLSEAVSSGATLVLALRSNEWNILKGTLSQDTVRSITEIEMRKITIEEAADFANCIKTNIYSLSKSKEELSELFAKDSYGFLYASMLMAVYDSNSLEDITYQMISNVYAYEDSRDCLLVLAAVVFLEKCGITTDRNLYKYLCQTFSVDEQDPTYYLRAELSNSGVIYQTRHESISKLFFKYLFLKGDWKNYLSSEQKEALLTAIIDYHLKPFDFAYKDYHPQSIKVIKMSRVALLALRITDEKNYQEYVVQRIFESCKEHGYAVIERVYHGADSHFAHQMLAEKCYEANLLTWGIYFHWINELVESEEVEKARTVYQTIAFLEDYPAEGWVKWAKFEERFGNVGSRKEKYSATWIFENIFDSNSDDPFIMVEYALFLLRIGNSAASCDVESLLKRACIELDGSIDLWFRWAKHEEAIGNVGDYESEGSAAWIFKKICEREQDLLGGADWIFWAKMVDNYPESFPDETGEDILRRGCTVYNANTAVWNEWAKREIAKGNIGDYDVENSAAWILKTGCLTTDSKDTSIWNRWFELVKSTKTISDDMLPLKALQQRCKRNGLSDCELWKIWAREEENIGNIGSSSQYGTASWIMSEIIMSGQVNDANYWRTWANFIGRHLNQLPTSDIGMAVSVMRAECLNKSIEPVEWVAWAKVNELTDNIGDYSLAESAAWIYKNGCMKAVKKNSSSILDWARFAHQHPMYDENEYIDAQWVLEYGKKTVRSFSNPNWKERVDFEKEITR